MHRRAYTESVEVVYLNAFTCVMNGGCVVHINALSTKRSVREEHIPKE